MRKKIFSILLILLSLQVSSQEVSFTKINERHCADTTIVIYNLKLLNNTGAPICIPLSSSFFPGITEKDTAELPLIPYESFNGRQYYSMGRSMNDVRWETGRTPIFPFIINPQTYVNTYLKFKKINSKKVFFDLTYSNDNGIDYFKIISRYLTEHGYFWEKTMTFTEKSFLVE